MVNDPSRLSSSTIQARQVGIWALPILPSSRLFHSGLVIPVDLFFPIVWHGVSCAEDCHGLAHNLEVQFDTGAVSVVVNFPYKLLLNA